jgi:hypothetical protein
VLTVIVAITGNPICSVSSYCDNNDYHGEVYMQCYQALRQKRGGLFALLTVCL